MPTVRAVVEQRPLERDQLGAYLVYVEEVWVAEGVVECTIESSMVVPAQCHGSCQAQQAVMDGQVDRECRIAEWFEREGQGRWLEGTCCLLRAPAMAQHHERGK